LLIAQGDIEWKLGTPVKWQLFGTGPDIVKAFEWDDLDIAYVGLPPAMIGLARGAQFKCVAGGHIEGTVIAGESYLKGEDSPDGLERVFG
ncbi:MAG: ABC transporter substrate-binding protein, partial [bacterium]